MHTLHTDTFLNTHYFTYTHYNFTIYTTITHTISAINKYKILPFAATWNNLDIILNEIFQMQKDKYSNNLLYFQNLKMLIS